MGVEVGGHGVGVGKNEEKVLEGSRRWPAPRMVPLRQGGPWLTCVFGVRPSLSHRGTHIPPAHTQLTEAHASGDTEAGWVHLTA